MKVLPFVVAVLACVAGKMWHFFSGNELKKDRFRSSPPKVHLTLYNQVSPGSTFDSFANDKK